MSAPTAVRPPERAAQHLPGLGAPAGGPGGSEVFAGAAGAPPVPHRTPFPTGPLSEVALALVSLAAVFGLRRVFLAGDWLPLLALQVVLAHATTTALRRLRVPLPLALTGTAAVAVVALSLAFFAETTTFGIPSGLTVDLARTALADAWTAFADVKAPVEALDGFVLASGIAVWAGAALGDWAAFRIDGPFEAILPTATLFVLAAVLGADPHRGTATAAWLGAVLLYLLLRRAHRLGRSATWVGGHRNRGPRVLVALGAALAALAVLGSSFVGPRVPGASSEAIVNLRDLGDGGPGSRVTISPLVDIRNRLVQQADVEVFTVRANTRSYWRLTSLDRFDGRIWSSNGSYGKVDGGLDEGVASDTQRVAVEQEYTVQALAQLWLPAAFEPRSIQIADDVRYDDVSGTLITEDATSDGLTYRVSSELPVFDPEALAAAGTEVPADIAEQYLALPEGFSPGVVDLARRLTAGQPNTYASMLALQRFFRDNFEYSLEIPPGHDGSTIERFVLDPDSGRVGYCEQFAGSFAAMARALGVPARVAVGFTPGIVSPEDPTLYRVRGQHAHAWPEVFLGEFGWVAFEPTPGRGAPFAEQYTGVRESQVDPADSSSATTAPAPVTTPTTASPESPGVTRPQGALEVPAGDGSGLSPEGDDGPSPWRTVLVALVVLAALALLYVVLVPLVTLGRRVRRRRAATEPHAKVALAWEDSIDAVRGAGVAVRRADTPSQVAGKVATRLPGAAEPIDRLARVVEAATFSGQALDEEGGGVALALADEVHHAAVAVQPVKERIARALHPSRLLR